jgi:hypothetical protein
MATKRTRRRGELTPEERRAFRRVKKISREARADVKRLLKSARAGTLSGRQLQSGLAEVVTDLTVVIGFHYFKI